MKRIIILLLALMPWCVTDICAQPGMQMVLARKMKEKREREAREEAEEAARKAREHAEKQKLVKKWQDRMTVTTPPPMVTVLKADAQAQQRQSSRETRQTSTVQPRRVTPVTATAIDSLKRLLAEKEVENRALSARCDSFQKSLEATQSAGEQTNWIEEKHPSKKEKAFIPPIAKNVDLQTADEGGGNAFAICFFLIVGGWILFWCMAIWPSSDKESLST